MLPDGMRWHLFADTSAQTPADVHDPGAEPVLTNQQWTTVGARSALVLVGRFSGV